MTKRLLLLINCFFFSVLSLSGQCPDNKATWERLIFLWNNSNTISLKEQLRELNKYELLFDNCPDKIDSTYAFLLLRIGATHYRGSDYLQALKYTRKSIEVQYKNALKPTVNLKQLVPAYYYLSIMYDAVNKVTEKMKALDSCAGIAIRLKTVDLYCLSALYSRIEYFFDVGEYNRCLDYTSRCEQLALEYSKSGSQKEYLNGLKYITDCFAYKVAVFIKLKEYVSAENLLVAKISECKNSDLENSLGNFYQQLAVVKENKGQFESALSNLQLSLHFDNKYKNTIGCKMILNQTGYIHFQHYHDPDNALKAYRRALTYTSEDAASNRLDVIETLNILANIANAYVEKKNFDSAFCYYQFAFDKLKPGSNETDLINSPLDEFIKSKKLNYLTALLIDKGQAFRRQFDLTREKKQLLKAIGVFKTADKMFDRIRGEQTELQTKLFWRNETHRLYEHAIEACYLIGNFEDAFYFFEKSKAVLLNDQLTQKRRMGEEDIQKEVQVRRKILQQERELNGATRASKAFDSIKNEIFNSKQELDRLINVIKENNPFYYQSFLDSGFLTLKDVRQTILKDHTALIELFFGDSAVYSAIITGQQVYINKIEKAVYDSITRLYISYVSGSDLLNKNFNEFLRISRQLYQLLFRANPLPPGRIIISPDGPLFPFEALITGIRAGNNPSYFLYDYAVSYTYSARFLMNQFEPEARSSNNNFLGIAPVHYSLQSALSPLPGSDNSLRSLSSCFKRSNVLIGPEASRDNFLRQYSRYQIIHLYTHASETSANAEPVLYFADSALYLSELMNDTRPSSRLIVLSACESGTGKLYLGEGVFSFNRGFAALGIPSAITNLWSVDNKSTYQLNELFYKYLGNGEPVDVALQKAKTRFIQLSEKENGLPYFWAASILEGKSDPIELKQPFSWKFIFLFSGIALLMIWVIGLKIKKKLRFD